MMQNCMEGMGSMMGGGVVGVVLTLLLLHFAWVLGLAALGALGVWAFRRFARS